MIKKTENKIRYEPGNMLSIDLEDWYQAFAGISADKWESFESRIEFSTGKVLELLDKTNRKATFFVLGWIAEKHPGLIKKICKEGHEIASHGYDHSFVCKQGREEFRTHLRKSINVIENVTGEKVLGFRAPWWSITRKSLWALDILVEEGIQYDSSIFPMKTGFYGINMPYKGIISFPTPGGALITEVPPSIYRFSGIKIPATGGFYLRLLPIRITDWSIKTLNKKNVPCHLYFHPWELDDGQPYIRAGILQNIIHYTGIKKINSKLEILLKKYNLKPVRNFIERIDQV